MVLFNHPSEYKVIIKKGCITSDKNAYRVIYRLAPEASVPEGFKELPNVYNAGGKLKPKYWSLHRYSL